MRRYVIAVVALVAPLARAETAADLAARAAALHRAAIVVDTHLDIPDQLASKWADIATTGATTHFDLPRAQKGGLTAPFFSIFVAANYAEHGAAKRALELIDLTQRVVDGHRKDMTLATSVADIRAAKHDGKLAVLMGIEGGHAIEDSMAVLREMYRAGVRYMTLTHTNTNHWADSAGSVYDIDYDASKYAAHGGLTDFGREVVKEMNRLGMIVDVSHVSDATIDAALAVSRAPIMASHSSCRALANVPRNLDDDRIKRIAAKGGIVMINVASSFLDQKVWDRYQAGLAAFRAERKRLRAAYKDDPKRLATELEGAKKLIVFGGRAPWTRVVDHIEHVIAIAGEDAVGIGSDFDGITDPPVGLDDVSLLPKITEELLRRGHAEARVKKVLGENFLAFFARVEAAKAALASEPPSSAVYRK